MRACNETRATTLAEQLEVPTSLWQRLRGLLGRESLAPKTGMLFHACGWIHTFFMKFTIDVLFLDGQGRVVGALSQMRPNRLSPLVFRARTTIELPAGTISQSQTEVGDVILFKE